MAVNNGSIGGSALGADYQAALEVWTDSARQNYLARGYVWSDATLLGFRQNLVMLNGQVTAGTSFGTNVNAFVLGQQVCDYQDSFTTSFSKTFSAFDWRSELWSYTNSWSFMGSGVTIRLAVDGGITMGGTASAAPLMASGGLNPRVWVDAGGTLSFQLLWITAGSLSGTVHLFDAQGSGTATIGGRALPSGGRVAWTASGMAQLCSGGGAIQGCVFGGCADLASWANSCPAWLPLPGSASGSI